MKMVSKIREKKATDGNEEDNAEKDGKSWQ